MLQEVLHTIIVSHKPKADTLSGLRETLSPMQWVAFVDLDDTITTQQSMLYARFILLYKFFSSSKTIPEIAKSLSKYIEINHNFIQLCKEKSITKICIISRNQFLFLEEILPILSQKLMASGISIEGCIWSHTVNWWNFLLHTSDKKYIIPYGSILISDMYEYRWLHEYPYFFSVDKNNTFSRILASRFIKYIQLFPYTLFLIFRWKKLFQS